MINYSEEFGRRKFVADNMKEAYLKACKWYATNVLAKDEMHEVSVSFEKDKHSPTVTIHLSIVLKEKEVLDQHCQCCKEMHKSFFINEDTNCNRCSALAYQRRMQRKIGVKKTYYKELFKGE